MVCFAITPRVIQTYYGSRDHIIRYSVAYSTEYLFRDSPFLHAVNIECVEIRSRDRCRVKHLTSSHQLAMFDAAVRAGTHRQISGTFKLVCHRCQTDLRTAYDRVIETGMLCNDPSATGVRQPTRSASILVCNPCGAPRLFFVNAFRGSRIVT